MLTLDTHVISAPRESKNNRPEWSGTVAQLIACAPNLVGDYVTRKTGETIVEPALLAAALDERDLGVMLGDPKVNVALPV